jgi:hypothetical protein
MGLTGIPRPARISSRTTRSESIPRRSTSLAGRRVRTPSSLASRRTTPAPSANPPSSSGSGSRDGQSDRARAGRRRPERMIVPAYGDLPLNNGGDQIDRLDAAGNSVQVVGYSEGQADSGQVSLVGSWAVVSMRTRSMLPTRFFDRLSATRWHGARASLVTRNMPGSVPADACWLRFAWVTPNWPLWTSQRVSRSWTHSRDYRHESRHTGQKSTRRGHRRGIG